MTLTAAHYVYLSGLASLIVVMALRKTVVVPAVAATFLTAVVATGDLANGLASIFRASLVAAGELFTIFLIIALITALLGALRGIGAEQRMVAPFQRLMVNGHVAYVVLFVVTYVFSLFFWPTPTLALVAAILLPAAVRAGLSPMGGAIAIAIGGQGMALASDYVIGVAPQLSASGAGVSADLIADRALVLSLIVGGIAITMSYFLSVRPSVASVGGGAVRSRFLPNLLPRPEIALETAGQALMSKSVPTSGGTPAAEVQRSAASGEGSRAPDSGRARLWAVMVPVAFLTLLGYMMAGRFTDLVSMDDGAGASLVGGLAALLLLGVVASCDGVGALDTCATHVVDGLAFAFKAMGVVIPIAGFVYMGISDFSGRIMAIEGEAPGFLFDAIGSVQHLIPDNPLFIVLAVMLAGMTIGLDGSGWAGLPLTGSLSEALGPPAGIDTATLAAIAQNGASWTGGGTLVIWSSLIAVAGFCGVNVVTLARRLLFPVVTGLVVASVAALFLW